MLSHANAKSVDFLLAGLPGGEGELPAISQFATLSSDTVSALGKAGIAASGAAHDMQAAMDIATFHHDAVQPTING